MPVITISLIGNLIGAISMALGYLSFSPAHFNDGDYYEETKFVKATPVEQHPKVKLNKFSSTKI